MSWRRHYPESPDYTLSSAIPLEGSRVAPLGKRARVQLPILCALNRLVSSFHRSNQLLIHHWIPDPRRGLVQCAHGKMPLSIIKVNHPRITPWWNCALLIRRKRSILSRAELKPRG
jgi:hypothetical protein